jgi:hypothetical protein
MHSSVTRGPNPLNTTAGIGDLLRFRIVRLAAKISGECWRSGWTVLNPLTLNCVSACNFDPYGGVIGVQF